MAQPGAIDRSRLAALLREEEQKYTREHPRSLQLSQQARECLLEGVPMHWMVRRCENAPWPGVWGLPAGGMSGGCIAPASPPCPCPRSAGKFPVFVTEGQGSHFSCVDGRRYIDFCLG